MKHLYSRSDLWMREDHSLTPQVLQLKLAAWKTVFQLQVPPVRQWSAGEINKHRRKGTDFLGIIVGSAGFINLSVLVKFRLFFHFFSDTFLKPVQHSRQCIRQQTFCATRVSRLGTDLIPARNPYSYKATAGQWLGSCAPHQLEVTMGSEEQGN